MAKSHLHEDTLMEIFLRLPAKSVGKFRCLSKTWSTNLSTSKFINLHLTIRKGKRPNLFLQKYYASFYVITSPIKVNTFLSNVELPTSCEMVVDSCNGLVLLSGLSSFVLVNPITLQHVKVPFAPFDSDSFLSNMFGFGYDHFSDDYKIVNLYGVNHGTITQVYSVKSKVWKTVNPSPPHPIIKASDRGVFTNGAIHWVSYNRGQPSRIVAFSLADELLYEIPSPESARDWKFPFKRVCVLEGRLCLIDVSCGLKRDLWIMKEYGVEASWIQLTIGGWNMDKPLCFTDKEEIVSLTYGSRVNVHNLVKGEGKDIVADGETSFGYDGVAFFDSLVSVPSDEHVFSTSTENPDDEHFSD